MAFKAFEKPTGFFDPDAIPWNNEFVKKRPTDQMPYAVKFLKRTAAGYMVVTEAFKAMVHEGSSTFQNIEEALPIWIEIKKDLPALFCRISGRRSIELGTDTEILTHLWHISEERYIQVLGKHEEETEESISTNPLLAGIGVHTALGKREGRSRSAKNSP